MVINWKHSSVNWGLAILAGIAVMFTVSALVKSCASKPAGDPAITRLEEQNKELLEKVSRNNEIITELQLQITSIDTAQAVIINKQPIINNTYKNEIFNILDAGSDDNLAKYQDMLRKSDSLLKAGFYSRTIELRTAAE